MTYRNLSSIKASETVRELIAQSGGFLPHERTCPKCSGRICITDNGLKAGRKRYAIQCEYSKCFSVTHSCISICIQKWKQDWDKESSYKTTFWMLEALKEDYSRTVIHLRYGRNTRKTQSAVAAQIGLPLERVIKIENNSLIKLKFYLENMFHYERE